MRTYYLFEIEADEKPVYNIGEWENESHLTQDSKIAQETLVIAYGEVENGKYIELYEKVPRA